jgi:hypothetical protein
MKATRLATILTTSAVIALVINHNLVYTLVARLAGAGGNVGVNLPAYLVFLVKLDHFFQDYFYVLIPFAWIVTFVVSAVIRGVFGLFKPDEKPAIGPVDL